MNQSRHGGTVQGSAPWNPAIKDATAVKPWSFTCGLIKLAEIRQAR